MKNKLIMTVAGILTALALPVSAHHSFFAEFDATKSLVLDGTIVKMEWVSPHSWLHLDVENDAGVMETWKVEGGAPNVLLRKGFTRDSFPVGTKVIINGFQAKDGSLRAAQSSIEFPDGMVMDMGGSQQRR